MGKVHRNPRPITDLEAVWLAAVIDCEGTVCVSASDRHRGNSFDIHAQVLISVANTNFDLLDKVRTICDCGNINGPHIPKKGQPHFDWRVKNIGNCRRILERTLPWLIVKKSRAEDLITSFGYYDQLMTEPLLDPRGSGRYQHTDNPKRIRLANRGHARWIAWLLEHWLPKHQPGTRAEQLCQQAMDRLENERIKD